MSRLVLESPCAEERIARAAAWLAARREDHVTIVGASSEAASEVARRALLLRETRAALGWQKTTLGALAVELSRAELARHGLVPAFGLALEAVSARVVHEHKGKLDRLGPIEDRPGLPRALARTVAELRLAGAFARAEGDDGPPTSRTPVLGDVDLTKLVHGFEAGLDAAGLADRARAFAIATEVARTMTDRLGAILLLDVALRTRAEHDFLAAVAARAPGVFVTVPSGDGRALEIATSALGEGTPVEKHAPAAEGASPLARLQGGLFGDASSAASDLADGEHVDVLSAPGESRECVEIARIVSAEARRGTPLDRMAVLLRAPAYAAHLEEALRRAGVPAFFAKGTRQPDAAGRALLALVACAAENLSARRFAEYLSLGEVPDEDPSGAPPPALPPGDRVVAADDEALGAAMGERAAEQTSDGGDDDDAPPSLAEEDRSVTSGTLRAPRHFERLLVDAAVIGGRDRWEKRLAGLRRELELDLETHERKGNEGAAAGAVRDLAALDALTRFALPLIGDLDALPKGGATWGEWLDRLRALATRAIRRPERVLAVLGELLPMAKVGPVDIREVRLVLERRLSQLVLRPTGKRYGRVYVATIEEARGLSFDVVFVPGLAEKIFPQKVVEDPLLLDDARRRVDASLPTNTERSAEERLALRLAVGAASRRVVLSYPRLDVEQARPRTPSFYGLEVLRVAEGELRGFEYLQDKAGRRADARIGWPAPSRREEAIDAAEYDLAVLDEVLKKPEGQAVGEAHYLLNTNEHLARALRFRGRRWLKAWKPTDGLVDPAEEALAAIREHALPKRSFSPTALQSFAACPYRFLLSAIYKLAPREEIDNIEDLDPLTRGSLVHEVQFALLTKLRDRGMLPVTKPRLDAARSLLTDVLGEIAAREHERLAPAIERVWNDAIEGIAADLREWLRRMASEPEEVGWTPAYFELSFGLADRRDEDEASRAEPVQLEGGLRLRGSIDLVERRDDGRLRATDHKTGKVRAKEGETVIGKGETLQPVLYALTLEQLFPGVKVEGGRLYYCTAAGSFTSVRIALDEEARAAARLVAKTIGDSIEKGFLPAAPAKDACRFCDFRSVCGPYEEIRTKRKDPRRLAALVQLRRHR
jgi:CRISPR/Cas system-associated exonuclease Cas4 (RecB family)